MSYTPVVLFAYKRKDKLNMCLESLEKNAEADSTELYIFADGAKGAEDAGQVKEVKEYLRDYQHKSKFKAVHIIEQTENQGLAASVIMGVTEVIQKTGQVIVVEDDLVCSTDFLQYMNGALDFYRDEKQYGSVSAYTASMKALEKYDKDIYVTGKGECWGWGTWEDRWMKVDWAVTDFEQYRNDKTQRRDFEHLQYGLDRMLIRQMKDEIDSWAVRWCYHLFKYGLLTIYPTYSRILNKGLDGSGTNCSISDLSNEAWDAETFRKCRYEILPVNMKLERMAALAEKPSVITRVKDFIKSGSHK
ncbi:MAG: glycosyltransferase [Butyrivibrio sp.]|nr:glycosyltransferase [Butyrivibrio sp.]